MLLSFFVAMIGLILIVLNNYQQKRWLKFLLILWGFTFVFFANHLLLLKPHSTTALITYFLLLAAVFIMAWLSLHRYCQKLAQRHPEWIRATWQPRK